MVHISRFNTYFTLILIYISDLLFDLGIIPIPRVREAGSYYSVTTYKNSIIALSMCITVNYL